MSRSHRQFDAPKLVVASHNQGKIREIDDLLRPFGIETAGADALGLPEPEETGSTFIANAELKALAAATETGLPALADDSGLAVDALDGQVWISTTGTAALPLSSTMQVFEVQNGHVREVS